MRRASAIASIICAACLVAPAAQAEGALSSAWAETCVNTSVKWDFSPRLLETEVVRFGTATVNYQTSWTCGFGGASANVDLKYPSLNPGAGVRIRDPGYFVIPTGTSYSYIGNCAAATLIGGATGATGTVVDGTMIELVHRDPNASAGVLSETSVGGTDHCQQQHGLGVSTVSGAKASWDPIPIEAVQGGG